MKLYIKHMVSNCCKTIVRATLKDLGLHCVAVDLGEIEVEGIIPLELLDQLKIALLNSGHELMDDKRRVLTEKIKETIIDLIHHTDETPKIKNSDYISRILEYDYTYLANLFSEVTGTTIEHYIIAHKIERAKELLFYDELNLTQIASKLNYSSVAHLSTQFKKVTGLTPTLFKQLKHNGRIALENVGIV
ncbi:helix-turn-helix domain-containing protein [Spirosoma spitsbergense]|uniref:helix-turn-helix domain-containing protein n=1 Tax=Spirosoma spitsbergense TaxID=431554 RepID=UPI000366222F|nr:AraC family transcriptional regulator [Spirosoma spitsbergense]